MAEWFGFRRVTRSRVHHGFKTDRPGSKSLCGLVKFGPRVGKYSDKTRPCAKCAAIWGKRYPRND